jgi:hypothetical protein
VATYTSTQAGNWNSVSTWGGGGYPNANDDVVNIGHAVTYNAGINPYTYGNVTITNGGTLTFPTGANSTLCFNTTGLLVVQSGGTFNAGTSSTPIGASYKVRLLWPTGSSARECFQFANGSVINIYGDPQFYGDDYDTTLNANFTSSSSGTFTIQIDGDFTSKWKVGQWLGIGRNAATIVTNPYNSEFRSYQINAIGAYSGGYTTLTMEYNSNAASIAHVAGATVLNLSRNVEIGNDSTTYNCGSSFQGSSMYVRVKNSSATAGNVNIQNALFKGLDRFHDGDITSGIYADMKRVAFVNCYYALNYHQGVTSDNTFEDMLFYSITRGIANTQRSKISGYFIGAYSVALSSNHGIRPVPGQLCIFEACSIVDTGNDLRLDVVIKQCSQVFGGSTLCDFSGTFSRIATIFGGFNASHSFACSVDGTFDVITGLIHAQSYGQNNYMRNAVVTNATGYFSGTPPFTRNMKVTMENVSWNGTEAAYRGISSDGVVLPLVDGDTQWEDSNGPPSGNSWMLEMTPYQYIGTGYRRLPLMMRDPMADYFSSGSHSITFKIYPYGTWATTLDQDDIYVEAWYFDGTNPTRVKAVTGTGTFANGGWRDLTVSFTTGRAGMVYFNVYMTRYESGKTVLIDPIWSVT